MSDRERTDAGTFVETVPLKDVFAVFDQVRGPVVTSSDVADALDCTTEAARQKLTRLYDQGKVEKRKTGRTVVYWRTGDLPERGAEQETPSSPDNQDTEENRDAATPSPPASHEEPTDTADEAIAGANDQDDQDDDLPGEDGIYDPTEEF